MSSAVCNVGDEIHVLALSATQEAIYRVDNHLDNIDILPLVKSADIVGLCHSALVEDEVNSAGMILYIEPVAHVLTLAIDRQRFAVADIVDKQRNEFLEAQGKVSWLEKKREAIV